MLQLLAAVSHVYQNHSLVCFRGSLCTDSESGTYAGPPAPWLGTGQVAEMALTELQDQERVCRGSSQFIVGGEILAGLSNGSVKLQSMQQLLLSLTTQCLASMAVIIIEYYQQRGQCMKQITLPRFQKVAKM